MKRMHVHVAVADLEQSIGFYSALFAAQPAVIKADYAKWMLDDPRVNFAVSTRGKQPGLDHLGIQVESKDELSDVYARLRRAGGTSPVSNDAGGSELSRVPADFLVDSQGLGTFDSVPVTGADYRAQVTANEGQLRQVQDQEGRAGCRR